jgi:Kef-type K+ transport system membrane component KefB
MSLLGLAFLLLLAGLEVEFEQFRGRLLKLTGLGFVASLAIALVIALGLDAAGLVKSPLLIAIIAAATSLGVVIPVLKDAGESSTQFGQVVLAGASIADVATIVLLSLFFSSHSSGLGAKLSLLGAFATFVAAIGLAVLGAERSTRLSVRCSGCRTPPPRSGFAAPLCCSSASSSWRRSSGSRRFSARSWPAPSSSSSTATRR